MGPQAKSTLTMLTLVGLLAIFVVAGWMMAFAPLPDSFGNNDDGPACETREVVKGETINRADVTVSVFNATTTDGLATRTMKQFVKRGFGEGETGNVSEVRVPRAQVWAADPENPAAKLVAAQLGPKTRVLEREELGVGVTVVIGKRFRKLVSGPGSIKVVEDSSFCARVR